MNEHDDDLESGVTEEAEGETDRFPSTAEALGEEMEVPRDDADDDDDDLDDDDAEL